jgi:hypothetical protein
MAKRAEISAKYGMHHLTRPNTYKLDGHEKHLNSDAQSLGLPDVWLWIQRLVLIIPRFAAI